ncbi:type IV secretion system protein [Paeniglutamicibacter antarcticus]|uniref:Type IV secretion system protein n=1 Tax=Arthrobacter terrae TaxID=2935737 RepID=A0A931G9N1_9MICC|nr:type IV secretion system protein [Arthrobacter terrae]MBG0741314.1 type IV secretion system protein [Arthrobacter terrae]
MLPMVKCDLGGWWPPGCGIVSQANDNFASSVTSYIAGILENMASWMWSFISGAFGVSDIDASEWGIVNGLTNWWVVVMMTPLVVVMIVQMLAGLVSQQSRRIGRALLGGAFAIPLVYLATSLMSKLSSFTDSASTALLATLGKDPFVVFMRLFGFQKAEAGSGREWDVVSLSSGTADGPTGAVVVTAIAVLVVWILSFILMCSMIFRSFALLVLAAVAPVALMLLPWERTKSWSRVWCETVIALLIAKPLAATVLAVAVKLFANSTSFSGLASGAVGMVLACGAPLMALKLVSFAGGEIAGAAQMAGGGHVASRAGSFTGRQLGRQFGGKLHMPGVGSKGPTPVASKHSATPLRPNTSMHPGASKAWIDNPTQAAGPTASSPKAQGPASGGSQGPGPATSTAWPMPPGPAAKGGQVDPPVNDHQPSAAPGRSDPTPAAPTTSRYPHRSHGSQNRTTSPQNASTFGPASKPVTRPSFESDAVPRNQPPRQVPVNPASPVDPSGHLPKNPPTNGDGHHD